MEDTSRLPSQTPQGGATVSRQREGAPAEPGALLGPEEAFARMGEDETAELRAHALGVQAVIWGMQWVKGGQAMRIFSTPLPPGATRSALDPRGHQVNVWGHARGLLTDKVRLIETPNTETPYSTAVVDLGDGPVVVVHPDLGERYFRTSIWELHGDTHTISQKQDGGHPPSYALLPLDWDGDVPAGMKSIRVRSRYVLIAAHIAVYGEEDLQNLAALQDGLALVAWHDWGASDRPLTPGAPMRPLHLSDSSTPPELLYFEELCETLKDLRVRDDEIAFARQLEGIGITLTEGFDPERLDLPTVAGLKRAVLDAQTILEHKARTLSPVQPGGTWQLGADMTSVDDWLFRGAVGWKHVWGDSRAELIFPIARADADGRPFHGSNTYALRFPPGELPPARYWRITMYDLAGFLVGNPIDRFGIGTMAETPRPDPDGGLTILIQHDSPGAEREVNWLPAPADGFFLILRMYQPEERMYRGEYTVPAISRTS